MVGPIVGGFLSNPEKLLAGLIKRIPYLKKVPFAIPLSVGGLISLICTSISVCSL